MISEDTLMAIVVAIFTGIASAGFGLLFNVGCIVLGVSSLLPRKKSAIVSVTAGLACYYMIIVQNSIEATRLMTVCSFSVVTLCTLVIYYTTDKKIK